MKLKKVNIIFILSSILLIYSLVNIINWVKDSYQTNKIKNSLVVSKQNDNKENDVLFNAPKNLDDPYWDYLNEDFLSIDFQDLQKQNNDVVGWINLAGTEIDYPIVQAKDNSYYLTHSFDKSENKAGWIFLDYRNNFNSLSFNTIIYGHRRKDNSMFTSLKNLLQDDFYKNYKPLIKVATPKVNYIWQIFSVYTIKKESYYITTDFARLKLYQEFLRTITKRSIKDFKTNINTEDRLLTLSSCYNSHDERIVVHAKLIKKEILN